MRLNTSPVCHKEPPYEYSTHVQTACVCSPHIRLLIGVLCNLSAGVCATMAFTCMNDEAEVYISCVCESVCVIPTRAVMASLIPPFVISSVPTSRERVQSDQEVNYLELTASHRTHISQQALLTLIGCLLLSLSCTLSVSPSQTRCTLSVVMCATGREMQH